MWVPAAPLCWGSALAFTAPFVAFSLKGTSLSLWARALEAHVWEWMLPWCRILHVRVSCTAAQPVFPVPFPSRWWAAGSAEQHGTAAALEVHPRECSQFDYIGFPFLLQVLWVFQGKRCQHSAAGEGIFPAAQIQPERRGVLGGAVHGGCPFLLPRCKTCPIHQVSLVLSTKGRVGVGKVHPLLPPLAPTPACFPSPLPTWPLRDQAS